MSEKRAEMGNWNFETSFNVLYEGMLYEPFGKRLVVINEEKRHTEAFISRRIVLRTNTVHHILTSS